MLFWYSILIKATLLQTNYWGYKYQYDISISIGVISIYWILIDKRNSNSWVQKAWKQSIDLQNFYTYDPNAPDIKYLNSN